MHTIAVILAGGSGRRFGADRPKQFLELEGQTLLARSLSAFEGSPLVDEICLVLHPDWLEEGRREVEKGGFQKVRHIVSGGSERYESSVNALDCYPDGEGYILFHDAVRPLVSGEVIARVVEALDTHAAVGVMVPCVDTVVVHEAGTLQSVPVRSTLGCMQTPQGFHLPTIREAYRRALQDPAFASTDDCGVVHRYLPDVAIHLVRGEERNRKLTYKDDLPFFRLLLQEGV